MVRRGLWLFGFLQLVLTPQIFAETAESYFVIVYGYQDSFHVADNSHTFATFVHTTQSLPNGEVLNFEEKTISWLPLNARVRVLALLPERGRNFGLKETIEIAAHNQFFIKRWGPARISEDLYRKATLRYDFLNAGGAEYKANDLLFRRLSARNERGGAVNCIHAVLDIVGIVRTFLHFGFDASRDVYKNLAGSNPVRFQNDEWVAKQLGVERIEREDNAEGPHEVPTGSFVCTANNLRNDVFRGGSFPDIELAKSSALQACRRLSLVCRIATCLKH